MLLQRLMRQQREGVAGPRPDIHTFGAWINRLWSQIPLDSNFMRPVLMSASQEQAMWQSIIAESEWSDVLMQTGSLARTARQAHRLMVEWRIPDGELKAFSNNEARAFRSWAREFSVRCRQQNRIEECRLADLLMEVPDGLLQWPKELQVYGLHRPTAQQQAMFAFLANRGCAVRTVEPGECNQHSVRIGFADQKQEFEYAASWAKNCLQQDPASRAAIALVDLPKQAPLLRTALDRVFFPENPYPSVGENVVYRVATGASLATQPIIETALRALSQSRHRVELAEFSQLLRSVFLVGGIEEYPERSRLDAHLRSLGELRPSLVYIAAQITDRETQQLRFACPQLLHQLHRWREQINSLPKLQPASAWAASFGKLLSAVGWPGDMKRTGTDIENINRWDELLSQLCSLDAMLPPMAYEDALSWTRHLARELRVTTAASNARLHILSIEDAASVEFEHLWVCGLNDEQWPPAVRPNPLLPIGVQQQYGIPFCSHDSVSDLAQHITGSLSRFSHQVVFSYAKMEGERENRISPLVAGAREVAVDTLPTPRPDVDTVLFQSRDLQTVDDRSQVLPAARASGGTAILKDQAACPFRAYINHRLQAGIPEEPEPGLDASERGILLHHVLESVWLSLQGYAGLVGAGEAERERIVSAAVDSALEKMVWKKQESLTPKFRELERERLVTMVMAWLHWEQQRSVFKVLKPEAKREIDLSGLKLKMRIDRIDENASGKRIVLDYKTGNTSPASWFGDRPDEPQLPLYALSEIDSGNPVAALSFAEVRAGKFAFKGIGEDAEQLPGVKSLDKHSQGKQFDTWDSLLQHWRTTLGRLAGDFVQGDASVDPKAATSCRYCELEGACRVNELNQRMGREPLGEDDDG